MEYTSPIVGTISRLGQIMTLTAGFLVAQGGIGQSPEKDQTPRGTASSKVSKVKTASVGLIMSKFTTLYRDNQTPLLGGTAYAYQEGFTYHRYHREGTFEQAQVDLTNALSYLKTATAIKAGNPEAYKSLEQELQGALLHMGKGRKAFQVGVDTGWYGTIMDGYVRKNGQPFVLYYRNQKGHLDIAGTALLSIKDSETEVEKSNRAMQKALAIVSKIALKGEKAKEADVLETLVAWSAQETFWTLQGREAYISESENPSFRGVGEIQKNLAAIGIPKVPSELTVSLPPEKKRKAKAIPVPKEPVLQGIPDTSNEQGGKILKSYREALMAVLHPKPKDQVLTDKKTGRRQVRHSKDPKGKEPFRTLVLERTPQGYLLSSLYGNSTLEKDGFYLKEHYLCTPDGTLYEHEWYEWLPGEFVISRVDRAGRGFQLYHEKKKDLHWTPYY